LAVINLRIPRQASFIARHWWLTPVILATQEGEIRRNMLEVSPSK
jgi:hypothetical protein